MQKVWFLHHTLCIRISGEVTLLFEQVLHFKLLFVKVTF